MAAPTQKLPLVFKLAENRAVKTINIKYGKITFAYGIVNSKRSKLSENPGAINKIILGINSSDKITRGNTISNINEAILLVKTKPASLPSLSLVADNMGIKAAEKEPSAKNLLKRLGILNAIIKASATGPDPKKAANKISLP